MKQYNKIWIDVTDMLNWSGRYTGIQRLVHEYSVRFREKYPEQVHFFAYDASKQHFGEIVSPDFLNVHQAGDLGYEKSENKTNIRFARKGGRILFKLGGKVARATVPKKYHADMSRNLRKVLGKKPLPGTEKKWDAHRTIVSPFSKDDLVIVMGGNWQEAGYSYNICLAHTQIGFQFMHMIHDMIPSVHPQWASPYADEVFGPYMKNILSSADQILTISESTKKDVKTFIDYSGILTPAGQKIEKTRLGDIPLNEKLSPKRPEGITDNDFIITVGTIEIRKNHILLYQTYREALRQGIELPTLYIIGRQGWMAESTVHMIKNDSELKDKLVILEGLSDEELSWMYQNCKFVVYPSIYEGWGLPIAEALAYGKACISSDQSSMPEIAGELVDYISPYSTSVLLEKFKLYDDSSILQKREEEVSKHYQPYTWDSAFSELASILEI